MDVFDLMNETEKPDTNHSVNKWEPVFEGFLKEQMNFDPAHDIAHVKRVVKSAKLIAESEDADLNVVVPAAWLHDCLNVPKTSKQRHLGSLFSADRAIGFLKNIGYPDQYHDAIHHAIHAHSFSANIETQTIEAMAVQDADRLDALGAIGLARCIAYSTSAGRELYDNNDPLAEHRELNESQYAVDHFYTKLLKLPASMKTTSGKSIAKERARFLELFLENLKSEVL